MKLRVGDSRTRNFRYGLRFKFGERVQTPEDFDRQVKRGFGKFWDLAWTEALSIIQSMHRRDLDIQSRFFNRVYKVRRDTLTEHW